MGKSYSEEFKIMVVKDKVENALSIREACEKHGVAHGSVSLWTDQYGFMFRRKQSDHEKTKNKAINEFLSGRSKMNIAKDYKISRRTLDHWIYEHYKQQEIKDIQEEQEGIFHERLRTVYPTSSAAYVTWAK